MLGDDLATWFETDSVAVKNTTLFLGSKAVPKERTVLILRDTGGLKPERVHDKLQPSVRRQSAQIEARAVDRRDALALLEAAYASVCAVLNQTINSTRWLRITPSSDIGDIGMTDERTPRVRLVFNVIGERV